MSLIGWMQHVKEMTGKCVEVTQDPYSVTYLHPGLNTLSFDREGNVCPVNLMSMAGLTSDYVPFISNDKNESYFGFRELYKDHYLFMGTSEFTINHAMHNPSIDKWNLKVKFTLGYIGHSTCIFKVDWLSASSGVHLLSFLACFILVDKVSRRATTFPAWYKERFNGKCLFFTSYQVPKFFKPKETFSYTTEMALRNQTSGSAATSAVHKGFTKDIFGTGVKKIQACYFKECVVGDQVDVHIWQEEGEPNTVRGIIGKGAETVCQVLLEYYGHMARL